MRRRSRLQESCRRTRSASPGVQYFLGVADLHEGRPAEAQASLRQAATQFRELKASDEEGAALAVLARALLAERKTQEADQHDSGGAAPRQGQP